MNAAILNAHAASTLNGFGWSFHDDGVTVVTEINGRKRSVFVPVKHLWIEFGHEFKKVGCPLTGVGDFSVGGWFSSLRRAVSRVAKKASRVVKRSVARVSKVAKTIHRKVVTPALNVARVVVNNPIVRHGIKLAAVAVPALAPVALGIEAAAQALKLIDDGKRAAQRVVAAARTGQRILSGDRQAMLRAVGIQRNMSNIVAQAKRGNVAAMRQIGAFRFLAQAA